MKQYLPLWLHEWVGTLQLGLKVLAILLVAWLLRLIARRLLARLGAYYTLPIQMEMAAKRLTNFVIWMGALLAILDTVGVSATVLWTAFTGFAAVGAVAFFAAWSVLSNIFCTLLIFTTRPFRLGDTIELVENGEKAGFKGRVVDVNLIYSTLEEIVPAGAPGNVVQIPNSLFFQRALRRWKPGTDPTSLIPLPSISSATSGGSTPPAGGGGGTGAANPPDA
jgi:small-conductance mechanosensitive channel